MILFKDRALKHRFITALIIGPISLYIIYLGGWPFLALMILAFVIANYEWFNIAKLLKRKFIFFPLGVIYLTFCFYCFFKVGIDKSLDALMLLLLVVFSDVGAYFTGKIIGGAKMVPHISPNKTWAGFFGAVLTPALVLIIAEAFFLDLLSSGFDKYVLFFIFGCLIGMFSQIGDILVSFLKRRVGIKDTGNILPGHGGVLDRIDSLLLASPIFLVLEYVIGHV